MAPLIELAAALSGVVLLLTAAVWAARLRRQAVRQLRLAILDPDPATRKAAVFVAAERGLGPFADLLVERAHEEGDGAVRHALAAAVARSQWEPADSGPLVELRLWAQEQLAATAPAAATGHGNGAGHANGDGASNGATNGNGNGASNGNGSGRAPRPAPVATGESAPAPAQHRSALSLATAPPHERPRRPLRVGDVERPPRPAERHQAEREPRPRPVVRRPARLTVLVTGAGGPAGVAVVRALMAAGHRVVAADAEALSAGLRLAPRSGVVPRVDDPTFVERLCDLAFDNGARALVPTLAEELVVLARHRAELEDAGVESWLPDPNAVEACTDKWQFAAALKASGLPGPATNVGSAEGVPGPWVVKPRFGRGSRDLHFVDDADEMEWVLSRVPDPIVQTRLAGREFTVDALVDRDGLLAGAVPRWRLETKAGISTKGRTFAHNELTAAVGALLAAVGLDGPANVQGFVADGKAAFVEINPRFSGGLPLSLAAGADLVGEYVRGIFGEPVRRERLEFRSGVTMTRHFEELFE